MTKKFGDSNIVKKENKFSRGVYITEKTKETISALAEKEHRSFCAQASLILEQWAETYEEKTSNQ